MTPQLQQAIRLLQLSNIELCTYVETELERNPLLERNEARRGAAAARRRAARRRRGRCRRRARLEHAGRARARQRPLARGLRRTEPSASRAAPSPIRPAGPRSGPAPTIAFGGEDANLEDFVAAGRSLADHLNEQLQMLVTDPAERLIGAHLIHMVDEAGYLQGGLDDLADKLGAPQSLVEKVLGQLARLRSGRRVRAQPRRMPGAAAEGPQPLRSADRQAARQPGPARQPQPRSAEARGRRRCARSWPR